jgi:succinoglycan biosynthesis protein ExoM
LRVALCVVTYRRPQWLAGSLQSIKELELDGATEVVIIVIDNDANGTAREVVEAARERLRWPLVYAIEPQQGISFARNRATSLALARQSDFIAFLDDDEIASPEWLSTLLDVQQKYRADVVSGPVLPLYEPGVPAWAVQGRFFERPRYSTGTRLESVGAGNCLIATTLLTGLAEPFHPLFALTGGEDTHFFRRAHRAGAGILWADDAVAYERVPPSRATIRWLLMRGYRGGTSFALSERMLNRPIAWVPLRLCTSVAHTLQGLLLLLPSMFLGKVRLVRALQMVCVGAGVMTGILGLSYREYTIPHGR